MKKIIYLICCGLAIISIIFIIKKINTFKDLNNSIGEKIHISEQLEYYSAGEKISFEIVKSYSNKMIVYKDSTTCSTCTISEIKNWHEIIDYNIWTLGKFGVVFILSPKVKDYSKILYAIKNTKHTDVVTILDKEHLFAKQNINFIKNKKSVIFMTDKDNKVVLVGNPMGNKKMWELYKKEIARLSK